MVTVMNFLILIADTEVEHRTRSRTANVYFPGDIDAKNRSRIRSLNEFSKINLAECDIRREGMHAWRWSFFKMIVSDHEFDDEIVSILTVDSQTDGMDYNDLNDILDCQLNSKENDDNNGNDDDYDD